jgi:hypothetical protein
LLGTLRVPMEGDGELGAVGAQVLAPDLARSSPQDIAAVSESGQALTLVRSMSGSLTLRALPSLKLKRPDDPPADPGPIVTQLDVRITSPRPGDVVTGPSGGVTLKVKGSANVVAGTGSIKSLQVKIGSGEFKAAQPSSPGNFATWTASQKVTNSGSLTITARATHSGDVLTKQRSATVKVRLSPKQPGPDTTPPDLSIVTPADDSTVVLDAGGSASVQVTGAADDSESGVSQVQVSLPRRCHRADRHAPGRLLQAQEPVRRPVPRRRKHLAGAPQRRPVVVRRPVPGPPGCRRDRSSRSGRTPAADDPPGEHRPV